MSSMFKKKGGLAFKPKIPSARPRPAASAPAAPAPKIVESQPSIDTQPDTASDDVAEVPEHTLNRLNHAPPSESPIAAEALKQSSQTPPEATPRPAEPQAPSEALPQAGIPPRTAAGGGAHEKTSGINNDIPTGVDSHLQSDASSETNTQLPKPSTPVPLITPPEASPEVPGEEQSIEEPRSETTLRTVPDADARPQIDTPAPAPAAALPASKPRKKPVNRKSAPTKTTQEPDGDDDGTARPKKRQRKASQQGDDAAPKPRPRPRKRQASASTGDGSEAKAKARKARSPTPEDAEDQTVDLQQLRMADLTKDLRIGKKFSRHDELRDRERQARIKAKLEKDGEQADGEAEASGSASPMPDGQVKMKTKSGTPGSSSAPPPAASGPQFRIVDGQIVVDQSSLVMDRHARAAAAQGDMETIEENDFTRLITSSSFMNTSKLRGPNIWNDQETELFYRGLRMFGSDFEMISKMFPGKQRRHVKLKFNREERHNPKRIDAALIGEKTIKMDIDEYRGFTGAQYESVEAIEAEQRKIQEGYEAERQRLIDEQAEIMRKKKEELFADEDGEDNGAKKKRGGKKKGKQAVAYGLNGEPILQDS